MKKIFIPLFVVSSILLMAFVASDKDQKKMNISKGKAKYVQTSISFGVGELSIHPCSKFLAEGEFEYIKDEWEPTVAYSDNESIGRLDIQADPGMLKTSFDDDDQAVWDLKLNKDIETDLAVKMGAGEAEIDLHDCNIHDFGFTMGAGEVDMKLGGSAIREFDFKAIAGEATIDFSGDWDHSMYAHIKGGFGDLTLILPEEVGVKVRVSGIMGDVSASGFNHHDHVYTNDAFGNAKETLRIKVSGGIGDVTLIKK